MVLGAIFSTIGRIAAPVIAPIVSRLAPRLAPVRSIIGPIINPIAPIVRNIITPIAQIASKPLVQLAATAAFVAPQIFNPSTAAPQQNIPSVLNPPPQIKLGQTGGGGVSFTPTAIQSFINPVSQKNGMALTLQEFNNLVQGGANLFGAVTGGGGGVQGQVGKSRIIVVTDASGRQRAMKLVSATARIVKRRRFRSSGAGVRREISDLRNMMVVLASTRH